MLPVLLILAATSARADLVAAAAASGRPAECMPFDHSKKGKQASVWHRARVPMLARYCDTLARAHARLRESPDKAIADAKAADKLLTGRAAPKVLIARALLAKGQVAEAARLFEAALAVDPRSIDQPLAMHALARTYWRMAKLDQALATYRVLVPRASLLPSRSQRARVLLEAAHASMAVAGASPKPDLDEALAYLREAARDPNHGHRVDVVLSLVLALDRAGREAQASALLAEQQGMATWAHRLGSPTYLASLADKDALLALAFERGDPAKARHHYEAFLGGEGGKGPWQAWARRRLAGVGKPGARKP